MTAPSSRGRRGVGLVARLATVVAFCASFMVVTALPAHAFDCKDAPVPEAPGRGVTGFFVNEPDKMPGGKSWVNGAPAYQHYANAGMRWSNYDLGCGPDVANDPGAVFSTPFANWALEVPKAFVSGTIAVVDAAFHPTYLQVFNPLLVTATDALRRVIFDQWVLVVLAFVGIGLVFKARKMQATSAAAAVGWAMIVMVVAAAIFAYPLRAGAFADTAVPGVLDQVNSGINGSKVADDPTVAVAQNLNNVVLFEQWKAGVFGKANSVTAEKYARDIYEGQSLTWAEARTVAADPDGKGQDILDDKADQWEEAAEKIKNEDPDAYAYLTGERSEARLSAAVVALLAGLLACPFLLMSAVLIVAAFLLIRMAVVFAPVILTLGVSDKFSGMVKGVGAVVVSAVINSVAFGIGAAVTILAYGIILSPDSSLPTWLALFLIAVLAVIMWVALKPFRRLTQMVSPSTNLFAGAGGAVADVGRRAGHLGSEAAKAVAGGGTSGLVQAKVKQRYDDEAAEKAAKDAPSGPTGGRFEGETSGDERVFVSGPAPARPGLPPGAPAPAAAAGNYPSTPEGAPTIGDDPAGPQAARLDPADDDDADRTPANLLYIPDPEMTDEEYPAEPQAAEAQVDQDGGEVYVIYRGHEAEQPASDDAPEPAPAPAPDAPAALPDTANDGATDAEDAVPGTLPVARVEDGDRD